jgi:rare lipoprotein A
MNVRRRIGLVRLLAVAMLATGRLAGAEPSADSDRWQLLASAHADTGKAKAAAVETGIASVYSDRLQGRKTASGETYDPGRMTAAHRTLPFGTRVKVTNARTHRSAVVTINDRGPALAGRILDLSPRAAKALGIDPAGVARVTVEVVGDAPEKGSAK